ncbi:hypothetical protein HELRODRAFT_158315 [Helobdella robusta]|uniref:Sushi domain-containing protein n=1 Tax=Helobdella robusta TaxID=6412 RepID=T1EMM9_HELRO|nr:hypothetical protein HELRODRAFT_158315 [Helobdella robusta]ESO11951.1 hypothetical protein HELRODRAFT_158315 [Helobdella robusta]
MAGFTPKIFCEKWKEVQQRLSSKYVQQVLINDFDAEKLANLVAMIALHLYIVRALPNFYNFGPQARDSALAKEDDAFTTININFEFPFFGRSFSQIHISTNGIIFFGEGSRDYKPIPFPLVGMLSVAAYWVDSDPRMGGNIYYREEFDPVILNQITDYIRNKFVRFKKFTSTWALIVTFNDVPRFRCSGNECLNVVKHQTILTSNGIHSFVIFLYNRLDYFGAQIGFNAGDGKRFVLADYSNTDKISKYALENSNVGFPGEWLFSISDEITAACNLLGMLEIYPKKVLYYGQQEVFISGPCFDENTKEVDVKIGNEDTIKCQKEENKLKCLTPYFDSNVKIPVILEHNNVVYKSFFLSYDTGDSLVQSSTYATLNKAAGDDAYLNWDQTLFSDEIVILRGIKQIVKRNANGFLIYEKVKILEKISNTGSYKLTTVSSEFNDESVRYLVNIERHVFEIVKEFSSSTLKDESLCSDWFKKENHTTEINEIKERESKRNPCQPTVPDNFPDQLSGGFIRDSSCNPSFFGNIGCRIFHKGAKGCYRSLNNPNNIAVQCCYNSDNMLIVGPTGGGTLDLFDSQKSKWEHFKIDVWPYLQCCIFSDECDKYYEKRPSVDSRHYVPPRPVPARGDPHFTTMDGTSYEFNPVGEFIYLQVPNTTVQTRIKQYVDKNNVLKPASYFAAFAIKIYDLSLQIEFTAKNNLQLKVDGVIWDEESLSLPEVNAVINPTLISLYTITGLSFQFYSLNDMLHVIAALQPNIKGQVSGLIGNWDDDPSNDFMLPNGTWIPNTSSPEDIHYIFGMSWATTEKTSIFSYPDGLKWSDYQNSYFVPFFGQPSNSFSQCGNNSECIFDAFVTGDVDVGLTNVHIEETINSQITEYQHMQITCSPNIHVAHANVNAEHNSDYTQVDYSIVCEPGYMLSGKSSVSCVEGKYSNEYGSCVLHTSSSLYTLLYVIIAVVSVILSIIFMKYGHLLFR